MHEEPIPDSHLHRTKNCLSPEDELPINNECSVFLLKTPHIYLSSKVKDLATTAADGLVTSFLSNQCLQAEKLHIRKTDSCFCKISQETYEL